MTKEEAIKYLQQLYPNGGHCWLDEQRMEAIGMAIKALQKEPVSEELEKFANESSIDYRKIRDYQGLRDPIALNEVEEANYNGIMAGAQWQKEQFEKNRLKHCDSITNEQAELEQGFIDQHLDKHQRMPTFLDAIEYGMRLQKEQIEEVLLSEVLPCFMHGGEADEVVAKLDEVLNQKK